MGLGPRMEPQPIYDAAGPWSIPGRGRASRASDFEGAAAPLASGAGAGGQATSGFPKADPLTRPAPGQAGSAPKSPLGRRSRSRGGADRGEGTAGVDARREDRAWRATARKSAKVGRAGDPHLAVTSR
jgi:hypothetical protein